MPILIHQTMRRYRLSMLWTKTKYLLIGLFCASLIVFFVGAYYQKKLDQRDNADIIEKNHALSQENFKLMGMVKPEQIEKARRK